MSAIWAGLKDRSRLGPPAVPLTESPIALSPPSGRPTSCSMIAEDSRPHMTRILRDHGIGLVLVAIAGLVPVTSVAVVASVAAVGCHSDLSMITKDPRTHMTGIFRDHGGEYAEGVRVCPRAAGCRHDRGGYARARGYIPRASRGTAIMNGGFGA